MSHDLLQMAHDPSPAARRELLDAATSLYLAAADPSADAREDYAVIAMTSLEGASTEDRAGYAKRVAAESTLPQPVAIRLAADEAIEVAHLVLKLSPVLTDEDLTTIAATHSQQHLIAIAERAAIAEITADVLTERGNIAVLRTLSGNPGAQLSEGGVARMLDRSRHDTEVVGQLAQRAARPERQAQRVLRLAVQVEQAEAQAARRARRRHSEVNQLIADVLKGRRPLGEAVLLLARQDHAFELAVVIATFAKRSTPEVLRALLKPQADDIVAICAPLRLPVPGYEPLARLRARRLGLGAPERAREIEAYGTALGNPDTRAA
ncbi:MAG TPA: DUF2336 domain-containing protein [Microvirga sp.]|jgi:hypothetical protein